MKEAQKRIQVYGRNELTSKRAILAEVMMKLGGMIPGFQNNVCVMNCNVKRLLYLE